MVNPLSAISTAAHFSIRGSHDHGEPELITSVPVASSGEPLQLQPGNVRLCGNQRIWLWPIYSGWDPHPYAQNGDLSNQGEGTMSFLPGPLRMNVGVYDKYAHAIFYNQRENNNQPSTNHPTSHQTNHRTNHHSTHRPLVNHYHQPLATQPPQILSASEVQTCSNGTMLLTTRFLGTHCRPTRTLAFSYPKKDLIKGLGIVAVAVQNPTIGPALRLQKINH